MPDGVDASMNAVEPTGRDSSGNRSPIDAELPELRPRDHAVLAFRQRRNLPSDRNPRVCVILRHRSGSQMTHTPRLPRGVLQRGDLCDG
jgi:hypothetical protein